MSHFSGRMTASDKWTESESDCRTEAADISHALRSQGQALATEPNTNTHTQTCRSSLTAAFICLRVAADPVRGRRPIGFERLKTFTFSKQKVESSNSTRTPNILPVVGRVAESTQSQQPQKEPIATNVESEPEHGWFENVSLQ